MNHQAKKKFGQNFLRDKNLLMKIVRDSHIHQKFVIEVGPGQGALTSFLAEHAEQVIAYEIDKSLKPILDLLEEKYHNLKVIYGDFLQTSLPSHDEMHVVANVPYYITTPILFKILEHPQIKTASLMIQKEVCDRLLATPNSKQYNALSVILQNQAKVSKMLDVKRHLFHPVPQVDSAVIRIEKYENHPSDLTHQVKFNRLIKEAFRQKRKTLVNNWHQAFNISKGSLESFLEQQGFSKDVRAEQINLEQFKTLVGVWPYEN